jgi:chromate transporter
MKDDDPIWGLIVVYVPFSLVSIGGGMSVIASMQHEVVDVRQWVTAREFVDLFAIARAAPGPGSMLTTLVGWHIAGWAGAVVATLALLLPSSILCYFVNLFWRRHQGKRWHTALEKGLAPVGIGLVLAGTFSVFRLLAGGPLAWGIALGSAALLTWNSKVHPLLLFLIGGSIFVAAQLLGLFHPTGL